MSWRKDIIYLGSKQKQKYSQPNQKQTSFDTIIKDVVASLI